MNKTDMKRFVRLACLILAAAFLFVSTGPAVHAQGLEDHYLVAVWSRKQSICAGQSTLITVSYGLKKGMKELGAPIFTVRTTIGTVTPSKSTGGLGSGLLYFTFTSKEAGTAEITATANEADGSATMTIEVQKDCQYSYQLWVSVKSLTSYEGIVYNWEYILIAKGTFIPSDLPPLAPLVDNMKTTVTINDLQAPPEDACNVPATVFKGLSGSGKATASGKFTGNQVVTFMLTDAKIEQDASFTLFCKDGSITRFLPLSYSGSNWIQEDFLDAGGMRSVEINTFERGVDELKDNPGTDAYYSAVLIVEKIK